MCKSKNQRYKERRILKLYYLQQGRCFICNEGMDINDINIDHVFPVSKYKYKNRRNNFLLAHIKCNSKKGNRNPTYNEVLKLLIIHNKFNKLNNQTLNSPVVQSLNKLRKELFSKKSV